MTLEMQVATGVLVAMSYCASDGVALDVLDQRSRTSRSATPSLAQYDIATSTPVEWYVDV